MDSDKSGTTLELSTVYFYRGKLPAKLNLHECGLEAIPHNGDFFTLLYGKKGAQAGFLAAKRYADSHNYKFTVIDVVFQLDTKLGSAVTVKQEDAFKGEVLPIRMLSTETAEEMEKKLDLSSNMPSFKYSAPRQRRLALALLNEPEIKNYKAIIYPIEVPFSESTLPGAAIPKEYWGNIKSASCRLDPEVKIDITPPVGFESKMKAVESAKPREIEQISDKPSI